ncbi:MAG: hypothetical protein HY036_09460 [Nitrospirae bacterium]|nr:hypothetical protein [Nitrospirota bacterium]MBI3352791.1 hypothetical protein [Nitrospirota bacterium]
MKVRSPISDKYSFFLNALLKINKKLSGDVSYHLFYDLFKIRAAQWKYKVKANREVDSALSDVFQDLIAHYFRVLLPKRFEVLCEHKKDKVQPDIIITKNGKYWAAIEVKTTIGWTRDLVKKENYRKRLRTLSQTFGISQKRAFYIFEAARNVNREFLEIFEKDKPHKLRRHIYPLFLNNAHPFNLSEIKGNDRKNYYEEFLDNEIYDLYKRNRVTRNPLQAIIRKKILD